MEKYYIIQPYLIDGVSIKEISSINNVSKRTLHYWVKQYQTHGLVGLITKPRSDIGTIRVDDLIRHEIEQIYLLNKRLTVTSVHRKATSFCLEKDLKVPSYYQVSSIIKAIPTSLTKLAHEGERSFQNKYDLVHRTEASKPNEIWQADHTLLDIEILTENNEVIRPWLTIILDDYSRAIAGYYLSPHAPSAIQTSLSLHQAIWNKNRADWQICGIPEKFYTDHGSDFTSNHLEQVAVDLKIHLIFSSVGVPRGRGKIERFFNTINQLFLQDLPGYTKNHSSNKLLSLQELDLKFTDFIINIYHHRVHGTTKEAPINRWNKSGFLPNLPESMEQLDLLLLMVAKVRIVQRDGIHFNGFRYMNAHLSAYVGEAVLIRYDPRDLAEIRIFHQDHFLCTAIAPDLSDFTVNLKDIVEARKKHYKELKSSGFSNQTITDHIVQKKQEDIVATEQKSTRNKTKLRRYHNE